MEDKYHAWCIFRCSVHPVADHHFCVSRSAMKWLMQLWSTPGTRKVHTSSLVNPFVLLNQIKAHYLFTQMVILSSMSDISERCIVRGYSDLILMVMRNYPASVDLFAYWPRCAHEGN